MTVLRHPNNQGVTLQQWRKTAAGGETSLSGTDDFSAGLAYTVGAEEVFINGVLIERGVDYTATSGTAITLTNALVAGDLATVQSATSFNVANAIPKATVTAKGDVIVGTGASTVTNLAVGADGTTLVANSSASTGVSWAGNQAAGRNALINGAFDVAQRGTSIVGSNSSFAYTLDRWVMQQNSAYTVSRQATGDTTNLPNIQYCARVQRNNASTATFLNILVQAIETANSIPLAGKTITISFYARAGANFSSASNILTAQVYSGTGTDQNLFSGYTGQSTVLSQNATLTTTWQRFSYSATVASTATELSVYFQNTPTGTAGANDYYEVTGVQLELGSAPTIFTRAGGTLQGELAACQRYYIREGGDTAFQTMAWGQAFSTTSVTATMTLPVKMRVAPTSVEFNAIRATNLSAGYAISAINIDTNLNSSWQPTINCTVTGVTATLFYYITGNNSTSSYLAFNAEL